MITLTENQIDVLLNQRISDVVDRFYDKKDYLCNQNTEYASLKLEQINKLEQSIINNTYGK